MTADSLRAKLADVLGDDLDAHLAAFRETSGGEDAEGFVAYLLERGAITGATCAGPGTGTDVTVTETLALTRGGPRSDDLEPTVDLRAEATTQRRAETTPCLDRECTTVVAEKTVRLHAGEPIDTGVPRGGLPRHDTGDREPEYTLLDVLASGGLGEIHLARQTHLRRKVAYKAMRREAAREPELVARFLTEAQVTAQLDHPNVVPIYSLELRPDGRPAYAMKLVQGKELAQLIAETRGFYDRREPLDPAHELGTRLEHFLDVCDAIAYAHSKGVIHRDLKPGNIMVGRYNELYVIDWGIAGMINQLEPAAAPTAWRPAEPHTDATGDATVLHWTSDSRTQVGDVMGTPNYMSPEQAAGRTQALDGASDLYALGLILQELVTLERAIAPGSMKDVLSRARRGERERPVHYHPGERVPKELAAIIAKATRPRSEERYPSVTALRNEVSRYLRGKATRALPDNPYRKVKRWIGRHQTQTLALIMVLVLAGSAGVIGGLVHREALIEELHQQEQRHAALVERVAGRAHRIDNQLQAYQSLLHGLSASAGELLALPSSDAGPAYHSEDFDARETSPADLVESVFYPRPISTRWPVVKVAPDADRAAVGADLSRAVQLKPALERVLLSSRDAALNTADPGRAREAIVGGPPIRRAAVTLANGVHLAYPGMGGYAATFDGRDRPHYFLARHAAGAHWGRPFTEPGGRELMLPGAMAIRSVDGSFVGVASIELSLDHVVRTLLSMDDLPGLKEAMLVNRLGVTMVRSSEDAAPGGRSYFVPAPAIEFIARNQSGFVEIPGEEATLVAFFPLQSVPWHYVAIVDRGTFLNAADDALRGASQIALNR